jgi:thiamine pyrophosphokinase
MLSEEYIILADGAFPTHTRPLACLREARQVVCCDGAAQKLLDFGREPDYIVGDLDSLSPALAGKYADRLYHSPDQETNDQTKAVRFCAAHGARKITILGATGLREDHTLGNISLLADYAAMLPEVEMMTDYGVFSVLLRPTTLTSYPGQQISLFALDGSAAVSTAGLKYPLDGHSLASWWQGTLNEALGDTFSLTFEQGRWIVFRCY